jgi:Na+/melibiose symporter-like transporter
MEAPLTLQWVALVAMITSLVTIPLYALNAAVFLRLIKRGKLASTRAAHAVPAALFGSYVMLRLVSGSIDSPAIVLGLFVGWLCASAPYTLLVQWFWEHTQARRAAQASP